MVTGCSARRIGLMLTALLLVSTSWAQTIDIELNKLEDQENACRAFLVFRNGTPHFFEAFKLDMVLFDQSGLINGRLALDVAPLRAEKTSVKGFEFDGLGCGSIDQILINDVIECAASDTDSIDCVALLEPSSRNETTLIK